MTAKQKEVSAMTIIYLVANIFTIAVIDSFYGVLILSTHVAQEAKPSQLDWQINASFIVGFLSSLIETYFSGFTSISDYIQPENKLSFDKLEETDTIGQVLVGVWWVQLSLVVFYVYASYMVSVIGEY